MSEIADRYDRVSTAFATKVDAVPDGGWSSPSPCEGWTARDVVAHVVESHGVFLGFAGRSLPAAPSVTDAPTTAMTVAREAVLDALHDPGTATRVYEGRFGERTFEWAVDTFLSFDLVVHGWDLARATGQDETIDPDEVTRVFQAAQGWGEAGRSPAVFGPALQPPPDADEQTRMLAFLGRRA